MVELIESQLHKMKRYCDEFNKLNNGFQLEICGAMDKNMSMYCQTIKMKEDKWFGENIAVDFWESGLIAVRTERQGIDKFIKPLNQLEKIMRKKIIWEVDKTVS